VQARLAAEDAAAGEPDAPGTAAPSASTPAAPVEASAVATEEPVAADDGFRWYILQTYSGYENKVQKNLNQRIKQSGRDDLIEQVVIPTEDEIEIRDGQRRTVSRKLFPGYVLIRMQMVDEAWHFVRQTPGVTGFAGSNIDDRTEPTPLSDDEVAKILRTMQSEQPRINVGFSVGESVRVTDGPFVDFVGVVDEINVDKGKVRVLVSMFGRETPVELDFLQVEKQ